MNWFNSTTFTITQSSIFLLAIGMILVSLAALFYLRHARQFDKEYPGLSEGEFHWLIWPAIGANAAFDKIFGKRETHLILTEQSLSKLGRETSTEALTPQWSPKRFQIAL